MAVRLPRGRSDRIVNRVCAPGAGSNNGKPRLYRAAPVAGGVRRRCSGQFVEGGCRYRCLCYRLAHRNYIDQSRMTHPITQPIASLDALSRSALTNA